ncbi:MAG: pentapeptide repeat-containing protein [Oscillospiraceae bacterium]|nr:pentapeptide repeat-containing protein [Oscillospiraceae bacterium]
MPQEMNAGTKESADFLTYVRPFLEEETPLSCEKFCKVSLKQVKLDQIDLRRSTFTDCTFSSCSLAQASFTDVTFAHCDFSNSILTDAFFDKCCFSSCRCIGTNFGGSVFKHFSADDSIFQYACLDRSRMTDIHFTHCDFTEASAAESVLRRLTAKDCHFLHNNFFHTPLSGIDFSEGEFTSPIVSSPPSELKGITVNLIQAAGLAGLLGIHVKIS